MALGRLRVAGDRRLAIGAGVKLHDRRAEALRRVELAAVRLDEQRDADARLAELAHEALQVIVPAGRVEPAFGGALLAPLRHDAGGMRPMPERDRQHLVGRRHLEIERQRDQSVHQPLMSLSVMCRRSSRRCAVMPSAPACSAISAARTGSGSAPAARVPHGRHMVDVDAETERACAACSEFLFGRRARLPAPPGKALARGLPIGRNRFVDNEIDDRAQRRVRAGSQPTVIGSMIGQS